VRGVGLIWSMHLSTSGRISNQIFHISDWLPTLLSAARGYPYDYRNIDGLDIWNALKKDIESPRKVILHNIDNIKKISAITIGDWKLIKGIHILTIIIFKT
jgi:arylsulfatase B